MSIILVAPLYNKCCTFVLSLNTQMPGNQKILFQFYSPEGYCVNQFYFHQNVFAWAISTSPRRWTPCWRDQAMCAQQWQSLGPWQRNILKQRSKMCNKKKSGHTLASFPEDSNKITSRHKCNAPRTQHQQQQKIKTFQHLRCSASLQEELQRWRALGLRRQWREGKPGRQW